MTSSHQSGGDIDARWALIAAILIWLICTAVIVVTSWSNIHLGTFNDPDDALRLVEVRDWLAGQSWFDVSQYRSQPPLGASMHWSRLVDLPLAGVIAIASRFLPRACAEQVSLVTVPLAMLAFLYAILYRLTVELSGRRVTGVMALALVSLSIGTLLQFYPTRIDHHGWQILLGALGVLMLVQAIKGRRHGAMLAGAVMALALTIAIEGLPLAVAIGGAFAVLYWRHGQSASILLAYLLSLTVGAALLPFVMLGWPAASVVWCDALSPAYLWPMVTAVFLLAASLRLIPQGSGMARLATLAIAGAGAALVFRLSTPLCAAGPFASLDPLVYRLWYLNVEEGLPLWMQTSDVMVILLTPSILGIIAALWAIRLDDPRRRDLWIAMLVVQGITCLVSIAVMRAMGLAHLIALPGCAWLILLLFQRAQSLSTPLGRVVASVLCVLAAPIGMEALLVAILPNVGKAEPDHSGARHSQCLSPATLHGLAAIPPTILFAPLDISSHLLAFTRHSVVSTGHHRARVGMKAVISGFIAAPDQARPIIARTGASYVALCAGENEVQTYARLYPASLAANLLKGRSPGWLQRVPMRPGESIQVYRILPPVQVGVKRIATPFMQ